MIAAGRREPGPPLTIRPASPADYHWIQELSLYFWDETIVDCFDRQYDVMACPAFLACEGSEMVGAATIAVEEAWNAIVLVMLNVLPDYQGRGGGRSLLDAVREEAKVRGLARVLVATTNDDLPALALYQRYGFRITEIMAGRVAEHHGAGLAGSERLAPGELGGFAGIPVRDEVRLEYQLSA